MRARLVLGPGLKLPLHQQRRNLSLFAAVAVSALAMAPAVRADVVANGTTATSVAIVDGVETVTIAPQQPGGLSYNAYSAFDVSAAGVYLDNRVVGASSIVNEVFSANRSLIEGPVEVWGGAPMS